MIRLPAGPLPLKSVAAAVVAIRNLEPELDISVIEQTLSVLSVPGRFELLGKHPDILVDVGHNPHAARWLSGQLESLKTPGKEVHAVYAALADKDVEGVGRAMAGVVDHWYLAGLDSPRGLCGAVLKERLLSVRLTAVDASETVL